METLKYESLRVAGNSPAEAAERLDEIIRVLRLECPWDSVQTHESITLNMIEEAYEVIEAIKNKDIPNMREELGDVLLQVFLHSEIARGGGEFTLTDVINEECEKMIRRHPYIFSEDTAKTIDKALEKWENVKDDEHSYTSQSEKLINVPKSLPALIRAYKLQSKVAKVGFDWEDISGAVDKLQEETNEFLEELDCGNMENAKNELGDVLFSVVNIARFLNANPEELLTNTSEKFIRRFSYVEKTACDNHKDLNTMTLEEMDELWNEAKCLETK